MPKKTRQQKLRADIHRLQTVPLTFSFSGSKTSVTHKPVHHYSDFNLIKADIWKTVIWAIIFIAFEILVFILARRFGW